MGNDLSTSVVLSLSFAECFVDDEINLLRYWQYRRRTRKREDADVLFTELLELDEDGNTKKHKIDDEGAEDETY